MLIIRKEQFEKLSEAEWSSSVDRSVSFVHDELPEEYAMLGKKTVRERCERSMRLATQYNLGSESDCLGYVYAVFVLGEDFELEPKHTWASEILQGSEEKKAEKFWDALIEWLEKEENA